MNIKLFGTDRAGISSNGILENKIEYSTESNGYHGGIVHIPFRIATYVSIMSDYTSIQNTRI
jgi:hypothetical protein